MKTMKTKFTVHARAFDRKTGMPIVKGRDEMIDTKKNELFFGCNTIMDIKEKYESFWNYLNPHSEHVVFVQQITPIS